MALTKKLFRTDKNADETRKAKPSGYRYRDTSKNKHNYNRPTAEEIKKFEAGDERMREMIYKESRPERSDVNQKKKLETGGDIEGWEINADIVPDDVYWALNGLDRRFVDTTISVQKNDGGFKITNEEGLSLDIEEHDEGTNELIVWKWLNEYGFLRAESTYGKGGKVKRSKAGIAQDKTIKAKHAGKRTSADGNTYYESRANRSDVNRTKKFATGGNVEGLKKSIKDLEGEGYTIDSRAFGGWKVSKGDRTFKASDEQLIALAKRQFVTIQNNYVGKTAEQIWSEWTIKQREHFLKDNLGGYNWMKGIENDKVSEMSFKDIEDFYKKHKASYPIVIASIEEHLRDGQYATGGNVDSDVNQFVSGYKQAILFTNSGEEEDLIDTDLGIYDFDKKSDAIITKMAKQYIDDNKATIEKSGLSYEQVGMDVWYTQAGHGVGFFDRGISDDLVEKLEKGAKKFGDLSHNVFSQDGKVYIEGMKFAKGGTLEDSGISVGSWVQHKTNKNKAKVWEVKSLLNQFRLEDEHGNKNNTWYHVGGDWKATSDPKKESNEPHKYELGDKYRSDFDYDGMFSMGTKARVDWGVPKLEKLATSYEDVNYHDALRVLVKAIDELKNGNKENAEAKLKEFNNISLNELTGTYKKGGNVNGEFSSDFISSQLGRKLNSWKDYSVKIKGNEYEKIPFRNFYRLVN